MIIKEILKKTKGSVINDNKGNTQKTKCSVINEINEILKKNTDIVIIEYKGNTKNEGSVINGIGGKLKKTQGFLQREIIKKQWFCHNWHG